MLELPAAYGGPDWGSILDFSTSCEPGTPLARTSASERRLFGL
jgi:hypothetical protein